MLDPKKRERGRAREMEREKGESEREKKKKRNMCRKRADIGRIGCIASFSILSHNPL